MPERRTLLLETKMTQNKLELTDNTRKPVGKADADALWPIAGRTIEELCAGTERLLVFPFCLKDTDDRIASSTILELKGTAKPDEVLVATGNIMGFVCVGQRQLKIGSRFDKGRDDFFLHYMLQRVMHFNLLDMPTTEQDGDVLDLLVFMFPYFLKRALQQGLYREYRRYDHNDSHVRGAIDVAAHMRMNMPFNGRVAYTTKDYSYDNSLTQLIRHTIEFIATRRNGRVVLELDRDTADSVRLVTAHTASYRKCCRADVVRQNLRGRVHPFYTHYTPLRALCLQILRHDELQYGDGCDEVYGILFDGAWLWEEYVNVVLEGEGFVHAENKNRKKGIYLFCDKKGVRYPDFYKAGFVLDAKYKKIAEAETPSDICREDIHQLMTYMYALNASKGGLVAPFPKVPGEIVTFRLKDKPGHTLSVFGIEISKATTYRDFVSEMAENERRFLESIKQPLP